MVRGSAAGVEGAGGTCDEQNLPSADSCGSHSSPPHVGHVCSDRAQFRLRNKVGVTKLKKKVNGPRI